MKKNNIMIILLIGISLIFAGCSSNTGAKQSGLFGIGSGTSSNSNEGSGITLSFADNNPPDKMIKGAPTTFAFIFTNYQKHDVSDLKLKTKGFERGYVNGLEKNYNIANIPKYTTSTGPGVYSGFLKVVTVDDFTENFFFNPTFEYCYTAKTVYREQACIPSSQNQCDIQIDKSITSNGPINVNVDRINSIKDNLRIQFSLSNNGIGKVVNTCFKTDEYSNTYKLNSVTLGTTKGQCTATSGYKLNNGIGNFVCNFERTSTTDAYASQITVELEYLYDQELKKQITVEDLNYNVN